MTLDGDLLTLEEVARELRCSKAHVSKLAGGKVQGIASLPALRLGRRILFRRSSLERWASQNESTTNDGILHPSPRLDAENA
jgi:excisionase family DNA binding protein